MTSWSDRVVTWGFALVLSGGLLFLCILAGVLVDEYVHPLAAIPVFIAGGVFVVAYFKEMVKE